MNKYNSHQYIPQLDFIRAIAVIGVVGMHAHIPGFIGGGLGVQVFFVLSGFLITDLLIKNFYRDGKINFVKFYFKRALRLLPAAFLMYEIICLVMLIFYSQNGVTIATCNALPFCVIYIQNLVEAFSAKGLGLFAHTWSLAVEWQFYILYPFAFIFLIKLKFHKLTSIVLLLLACVFAYHHIVYTNLFINGHTYLLPYLINATDMNIDGLLFGASLAFWITKPFKNEFSSNIHPNFAFIALILILWFIWFNNDILHILCYYLPPPSLTVELCTVILIWSIVGNQENIAIKALNIKILVYIGRISYGIYLWHFPINGIIELELKQYNIYTSSLLVLSTFFAAIASYHLIEQPILKKFKTN